MVKKICEVCNKVIYLRRNKIRGGEGRFCSYKCYSIGRKKTIINYCLICNKIIYTVPSLNIKLCSKQCKKSYMSKLFQGNKSPKWKRIKKRCIICEKSFYVRPCEQCYKCCSKKCRTKFRQKYFSGINGGNYRGGKHIDKTGYVLILNTSHPFCNNCGYVREHRLVMEKHLGRYLEPVEQIHHINGIKDDNRIENLRLFKSNSEHIKFHNKGLT